MPSLKDVIVLVAGAGVGTLTKSGPSGRAIIKRLAMPDSQALEDAETVRRIAIDLSEELEMAIKWESGEVVIFADPPLLDALRSKVSLGVRRRLLGIIGSTAVSPFTGE